MITNQQEQQKKNTRAEQSRINGAKSNGAKTEEGQDKAKIGNLKHGAYAHPVKTVLKTENQEAYNQLLAETHQEYDPGTALEEQIVQEITDATWQIRRLKAAVTARLNNLIDHEDPQSIEFALIDQAVLILERRIRQSRSERSRLILDLQRLKKLTPIVESSRAARNPEAYARVVEYGWVDRLTNEDQKPTPEPIKKPATRPHHGPRA